MNISDLEILIFSVINYHSSLTIFKPKYCPVTVILLDLEVNIHYQK